ncbi:MAG: hypothetical protein P4L35_17290 [Ignavibacteriaceae bacterium]|nr:hypothetical protein [Ignavibacteriaceae bacterium]
MKTSELFLESLAIRDKLIMQKNFIENKIDSALLPVLPFRITDKIKLIIIGQDPTVKNAESRKKIEYTLNLDKKGSLKKYISDICTQLGIEFENVYATNIFKYFYSVPPESTMHVLIQHLEPNLELLKKELAIYPKQPIITLGLPVLQLLTNDKTQVRDFWGYDLKTKQKGKDYCYCRAESNKLNRDIFSFPHQPSIIKKYYASNINGYIEFMKTKCKF